jgi:DNA-binding NtrC family response regulator
MLTGNATTNVAVRAMKEGFNDFLIKNSHNFDQELLLTLKKAEASIRMKPTINSNKAGVKQRLLRNQPIIIGESKSLKMQIERATQAAKSSACFLITGETGTGKELIAEYIHSKSERAGNFRAINCAQLSKDLLHSHLFGHVKGAFTGASQERKGEVHAAEGGTLFLDEIGDMDLPLQAYLLRFLQDKSYSMLGSDKIEQADVRILTATNKDLHSEVEAGRFREDLYYRINVIPLHMPPLRERRDDIPLLVNHIINKYKHELDVDSCFYVNDESMEILKNYEWPGNIREIENVIWRALLLSRKEEITSELLILENNTNTSANRRQYSNIKENTLTDKNITYDISTPTELSYVVDLLLKYDPENCSRHNISDYYFQIESAYIKLLQKFYTKALKLESDNMTGAMKLLFNLITIKNSEPAKRHNDIFFNKIELHKINKQTKGYKPSSPGFGLNVRNTEMKRPEWHRKLTPGSDDAE